MKESLSGYDLYINTDGLGFETCTIIEKSK